MDELEYEVHAESSHSAEYHAHHIKSRDTDSNARWTAAHALGTQPQFILLKLSKLGVLKNVLFGKYFKSHPCNVHMFEVYVGLEPSRMSLVLRDQLQNDGKWESFNVIWRDADGSPIPCRYVKIVPVSTHHANFHPSLWHVSLYGASKQEELEAIHANLLSRKEVRVIKLMAKYMRQRGFDEPCTLLLAQAGQTLEHPHVTILREAITHGQWQTAQDTLTSAVDEGLLDSHLQTTTPTLTWKRLLGTNADGDVPAGRKGHQMCFDSKAQKLFMLGGWDGQQQLRDFHEYSVADDRWRTISLDITKDDEGAPPTLQDLRVMFDALDGCIYLLVSLQEEAPSTDGMATGDDLSVDALLPRHPSGRLALYRCRTRSDSILPGPSRPTRWRCVSPDVSSVGGPKYTATFDVALDDKTRTIYMRTSLAEPPKSPPQLHAYSLDEDRWTLLPAPKLFPPAPGPMCALVGQDAVPCMWMLSANEPRATLSVYAVDGRTSELEQVPAASSSQTPSLSIVPEPIFGDSTLQELYAFHGAAATDGSSAEPAPNALWVYQCQHRRWMTASATKKRGTPPERVSFQTAYDPATHSFFQFGGLLTRGEAQMPLSQLWQAKLHRPTRLDILSRAMLLVREQQFLEMCTAGASDGETLEFLRSHIVPFVNSADRHDVQDFCATVARVYTALPHIDKGKGRQSRQGDGGSGDEDESLERERAALLDALLEMVNPGAREPAGSLLDAIDAVSL